MNSKLSALIILILFSLPGSLFAVVDVGFGFSSYTSGQSIPSVLVMGNFGNKALDFTSTGYASQYDYLAGYSSAYYQVDKAGPMLGVNLDYGFGGGVYYSERGYRMTEDVDTDVSTDFGIGPALFLRLSIGDHLFVRIQSLLGIGHENNLQLIFQDVSHFSLGLRW